MAQPHSCPRARADKYLGWRWAYGGGWQWVVDRWRSAATGEIYEVPIDD